MGAQGLAVFETWECNSLIKSFPSADRTIEAAIGPWTP